MLIVSIFLVILCWLPYSVVSLILPVPESAPIGHVIGYVEGKPQIGADPGYLVVFPERSTEKVLSVDDRSGEISTLTKLDYEKHRKFQILAVPIAGGDGIQVTVEVEDENNHVPTFPDEKVVIEISEYARIGAEYRLPLAADQDGPKFNVQKYRIAQGNVNNVFKISTRKVNEIVYADLVVNGQLDREYRDKYELIVEAVDGGSPEKIGRLRVQIVILDANDNVPIFTKPRYSISIPSSTPIGANILTVEATDGDIGANSRLTYRLQKTRSNSMAFFTLSTRGVLSTTGHLLPGAVHDLVVVASDHGQPALETTAFVSVTVQELYIKLYPSLMEILEITKGAAADEPALDIFWLTDTTTAHLLENQTLGSIVARVSLNEKFRDSTLMMIGCPALCLQQSDAAYIYLVMVCGEFDRETVEEYPLKFILNKDGQVVLEHPVLLTIGDVNDNAPIWNHLNMHITLNRTENENPPVLAAIDLDRGANGRIRYSILDTELISIDAETGRLIVLKELDCSHGSQIRFRIKAEDQGDPQLSSELQVSAELVDADGQPPHFEKPLYEVMVKEDVEKGTCLLKVTANNSVCGGISRLKYSWQDQVRGGGKLFSLDSTSGTICLEGQLDFEKSQTHRLAVQATDSNGLSSSCLIWIRVLDVNDNSPVFHPTDYNISLREGDPPREPILVISATDNDRGNYGELTYFISDPSSPFKVDPKTGEVYAIRRLSRGTMDLVIQAKDSSGSTAEEPAVVHVTVISADSPSPSFTRSKYVFQTSEDILPGISIGSVEAFGNGRIRYSIYSGDTGRQFAINPENGRITVTRYLDADIQDRILLNIQADLENGGSNHTQVVVEIEDHNDNPPVFPVDIVEVTIREDQPPLEPFYVILADDKDRKKNGEVSYTLLSSQPPCPLVLQSHTGQLHLVEKLDYESIKSYRLRVKATDHGVPPKSANITILLHVSDVNDNAPTFGEKEYKATILENSPSMTSLLKVTAHDEDSGENGKILYRITNGSEYFGIDEKTGQIYTNRELDREEKERYNLTVVAEDRGNPSLSTSVQISVKILDVNDNPPSCTSIQTLIVPSDADTHAPFGSVVAYDPDSGENGTVVYRLQQTHPLFVLTANGDVLLRRILTDSDPIDYRLSIIAADHGNPRKSAVCHVPIKVTSGISQIKLEEPFDRTIRIPQDCASDCRIRRINATGVAKWQLQSSEHSSHFIVSNSWLYLVSQPITLPPWMLTLVLSDKEGRQKHVQIKVLPPISKNLKASIPLPSTLPIGTKVAVIGDTMPDFYYSMDNKSDIFELDQISGSIYLNGRLRDHSNENIHLYFQKISILNQETEEIEMEFEIAATAIQRPIFKESVVSVEIPEDTPVDSIVATVTASAAELNSSILYKILGKEETFTVDEYSGDVILKKSLDCYETTEYNLIIEAVAMNARATILVKVEVADVNNNRPEIKSEPVIHIFPDSTAVVHTVVAVDRDLGENGEVSYELIQNPNDGYRIHEKTGQIVLEKLPIANEIIVVRVRDNGSPQLFTDQKIDVRLMNGTSSRWNFFTSPEFRFTINDSTPFGTEIGKITGKCKFYWTFCIGNEICASALPRAITLPPVFSFNEATGIIKLVGKPKPGQYSFTVLASSPTGEMDWTTVNVRVKSISEEILRISSSSCGTVAIPENRELSGFKRIITTGNGGATFRIQGQQSLFTINSTTGELSTKILDREQKSEHLLVIIAEELGKNDSCTVRVTVSDENDNSPQFSPTTPQQLTLGDEKKPGEVLYKLMAMDLDTGNNGKVLYELVDDPSEIFDLNPETGDLIYRRNIPYSQKEWMIRIKAKDMGTESKSTDRLIRIKDERVNPPRAEGKPVFLREQYVSTVEEGHERGLPVAKVSASGRDSRITYSIVEGNVDNAFEIDSDGTVRTAQELDYEIRTDYYLKIIATGSFTDEVSTSLQVKVTNLNDNPPSFPKNKNRKILESVPAGSYITTFTANDADMTDILEYSLLSEERRFTMDPFTGVIHSLVPLDYEESREIHVKARVSDGKHRIDGGFTILLVDVNDNPPEFAKSFFDVQISPTMQVDDVIVRITATDRDSGDNGRISYSLEGHEEMFQMSPDGTLTLITPVSLGLEYMTTVTATDHGHPRLSTSVPLRIRIATEEKKPALQFRKPVYEFLINENVPLNIPIGNVSISSNPQWYRIIDPEAGKLFRTDRFGQIYAISPLDRERQDLHQFEIEVGSESTAFSQNAVTTVKIRVGDVNDNAPKVENSRVPIIIRDGLKNGDVLYRLSAIDPDLGDNGQLSYRILSGNDFYILSLAPESGAIMFNEWNEELLSQYKNGSWVTVVEIKDKGHPSRSTLVYLDMSVSFSSWSATAPFFVQSQYTTFVEETASKSSVIFTAKAVNRAGLPIAGLIYSLKDNDGTFSINSTSGDVYLNSQLDYESISVYKMSLSASDSRGRSAVVSFEVRVIPVDEYPPIFSKPRYTFQVPINSGVGATIGAVRAVDADGGPHGQVKYGIEGDYRLVAIDEKTGEITLRKSLTNRQNLTIEQVVIAAYSSPNQRTRAIVYLEIGPFAASLSPTASTLMKIASAGLIVVFVILLAIIVFCILCKRNKDMKHVEESNPRKQVFTTSRSGDLGKMQDMRRMSPSYGARPLVGGNLQPKTNSMTSSVSTQSGLRSAMSHRDHVSTRSQPDSGIDPDTLSQTSSVTDYLVSLGVNPNPIPPKPRHRRRETVDSHLNELIYAKVEDVVGPGPLDVSKRLDYFDHTPIIVQSNSTPTFQPMSEIFSEISRLREEEKRKTPREYVQIEI